MQKQLPFWNPPSTLLASGPNLNPFHQIVGSSTEMGRNTAPRTSRQAAFRPPEPTVTRGHGSVHQSTLELATNISHGIRPWNPRALLKETLSPILSTSKPALALRPPKGSTSPRTTAACYGRTQSTPPGWHQSGTQDMAHQPVASNLHTG